MEITAAQNLLDFVSIPKWRNKKQSWLIFPIAHINERLMHFLMEWIILNKLEIRNRSNTHKNKFDPLGLLYSL